MSPPGRFGIIEAVAAAAFILFVLLYRRLVRPYKIILSGMELLREQDFSTRLRTIGNPEADSIIEVFNRMLSRLKQERLQVREKNQLLDLLIQATPQGIVILDLDGRISEVNAAGCRLLGIPDPETVRGIPLADTGIELAGPLASLGKGKRGSSEHLNQASIVVCAARSWIWDSTTRSSWSRS